MKRILITATLLLSLACNASSPRVRPTDWAQPVIGSDMDNFYKISDEIYRSEQPDDDDMKMLEKFGIKSIINLRNHHTDNDEAEDTSLKLFHIKMNAGSISAKHIEEFLKTFEKAPKPVLIHCWHGSDRTGTMAAIYRIIKQNWSKEKALDELLSGGYGYHSIYKNIPKLIKNLDIKKYKQIQVKEK